MFIPSIVPHILTALPRTALQGAVRSVKDLASGTRFRYKQVEPAKGVLHQHALQAAKNLRRGAGAERCCDGEHSPAPFKPMLVEIKTGVDAPMKQLSALLNNHLVRSAVLKESGKKNDARITAYAKPYSGFITAIRQTRSALLKSNRNLLVKTMKRTGRELDELLSRCDERYDRKYMNEFRMYFFLEIGKAASVEETSHETLWNAHTHAVDKVHDEILLSKNQDLRNYEKFLHEVKYAQRPPAVPPRIGAVAYRPHAMPSQVGGTRE